jgi:ABC-2 type transport system permease protein
VTTLDTLPETSAPAARPKRPNVTGRAFLHILRRDLFVSGKEFWVLLLQVALTPLFMLFIFAKVLTSAGYVTSGYGDLLLAGSIALSSFLTALQSVAFPLVMEFGWTKEIEDRLLAPLPVDLVTVEKLVIATLRGFLAGIVIYPIGALVLTGAPWNPSGLPLLAAALILGAWTGAGIGITIGTLVPPAKISFLFAAILTPLMFTGATQYPWSSLHDRRWFQVITAFNPMTYCAEAVRAALIPHEVPHIDPGLCLLALVASSAIFTMTGILAFRKRAFASS